MTITRLESVRPQFLTGQVAPCGPATGRTDPGRLSLCSPVPPVWWALLRDGEA